MFTYNIQLAGYNHSQYDEKGVIEGDSFLDLIEQFPWIEQLEAYNLTQQGASATISVINHNTTNVLWVSIGGNKNEYSYLVGYVYSRISKGILGLGKEKTKRWVDIYQINELASVKNLFTLFFNNNEFLLQDRLSQEEIFQSQAVKNN
jgi:hypothetical protein